MTTGVLISVRLVTPWTRPGNRKELLAVIPIAYVLALKRVISFSDSLAASSSLEGASAANAATHGEGTGQPERFLLDRGSS